MAFSKRLLVLLMFHVIAVYGTEWNSMDTSSKAETLRKRISFLEEKNTLLLNLLNVDGLAFSNTLMHKSDLLSQLKQWLPAGSQWQLCWRASQHDWTAKDFHKRCDYKGPTVTIVRVNDYIFGGYAAHSFGGRARYIESNNSFIFSLKNKDNTTPFKCHVYNHFFSGIATNKKYGPTFGGGHDLHITASRARFTNSFTALGITYRPPFNYKKGDKNTTSLLAGKKYFKTSEVEVFYLRT